MVLVVHGTQGEIFGTSDFHMIRFIWKKNKRKEKIINCTNLKDLIYYLIYDSVEPDTIVIGDKLSASVNLLTEDKEWKEKINTAGKEFLPIELGKICREICKRHGKKEPEIYIFSTFDNYSFFGKRNNDKEKILKYVEANNMKYLDKTDALSDH